MRATYSRATSQSHKAQEFCTLKCSLNFARETRVFSQRFFSFSFSSKLLLTMSSVCENTRCRNRYLDKENHGKACATHCGDVYFGENYAEWTCCKRQETSFPLFLQLPGCVVERHKSTTAIAPAVICYWFIDLSHVLLNFFQSLLYKTWSDTLCTVTLYVFRSLFQKRLTTQN